MIKHLSAKHEVVVASLVRSQKEAEEGRGLSKHCKDFMMSRVTSLGAWARMIVRLPSLGPSSMGYFYAADLRRRIHERLQREPFDLIFVHCSSVAPYVARVRGVPKILDFGDMDSQKWLEYRRFKPFPLSLGYWLEGRKMEAAEKDLAQRFDLCTCTTKAELETLRSFELPISTDWFPNGVDTAYFSPTSAPYDPDTIAFVGRMDYFPNQQGMIFFADRVFPRIRERRPAAKLMIIGAEPSAEIRDLARRPGINVTGTVPDVRDHVRSAAVSVAPLFIARGTQNKIIECMAMGVPVVTSREAAGGVDAVPGEHFLIAHSPENYAETVLALMSDQLARQRLAAAGRSRVEAQHSWANSMAKLDGIIDTCLTEWRST